MTVVLKNPETGLKKSNFFLQDQKDPFSELFSKILFKSSSEFYFLRNRGKFEIVAHGL